MTELQPLLPLLERMLGKRPSPATCWRWVNRGIKVGDDRVRLNAKRVGGQMFATPEAVQRFIDAQNPPSVDEDDEQDRSPELESRLQEAGLL